jgi:SAM-dependent methyltransferase
MSRTSTRRHIHPFPARMAPDIALEKIEELATPGSRVLDPMCGSGTVVRLAADAGCSAIGADLDPLAVMLTRTTTIGQWSNDLEERALELVSEASQLSAKRPAWITDHTETREFVDYWYATEQADDLSRLARVLARRPRRDDPLRVALSRLIVTKDGGASLARDAAHSRPHRTRLENDFDVFPAFVRSAAQIERLVGDQQPELRPLVRRCDARRLDFVRRDSIDLVVTSPPYLNAIDYVRGHRMSLVWLGWTAGRLRELRGTAVGTERGLADTSPAVSKISQQGNPDGSELSSRHRKMVNRFARDIHDLCRTLARVTRPRGMLVIVVADSQLAGVPVSNSGICAAALAHHGFVLAEKQVRQIPARHRYLPPPDASLSSLAKRMKEEVVYTFRREP